MSDEKRLKARVAHKHKTEAEWYLDVYTAAGSTTKRSDPFIPLNGELIIFDSDRNNTQKRFKFGDGETDVIALPFVVDNNNAPYDYILTNLDNLYDLSTLSGKVLLKDIDLDAYFDWDNWTSPPAFSVSPAITVLDLDNVYCELGEYTFYAEDGLSSGDPEYTVTRASVGEFRLSYWNYSTITLSNFYSVENISGVPMYTSFIHIDGADSVHNCQAGLIEYSKNISNCEVKSIDYCTNISNVTPHLTSPSKVSINNSSHLSNIKRGRYSNCSFVDVNTCDGFVPSSDYGKVALLTGGGYEAVDLPNLHNGAAEESLVQEGNIASVRAFDIKGIPADGAFTLTKTTGISEGDAYKAYIKYSLGDYIREEKVAGTITEIGEVLIPGLVMRTDFFDYGSDFYNIVDLYGLKNGTVRLGNYGEYSGSGTYTIISGNPNNHEELQVRITGTYDDLSQYDETTDTWGVTCEYDYTHTVTYLSPEEYGDVDQWSGGGYSEGMNTYTIIDVSTPAIFVTNFTNIPEGASLITETIEDNIFYLTDKPDVGTKEVAVKAVALGESTRAAAPRAFVSGKGTIATTPEQVVSGRYNEIDKEEKYAHVVGGGSSDENRENIYTLDWEGNAHFAGDVYSNGRLLNEWDHIVKTEEEFENIGELTGRILVVDGCKLNKAHQVTLHADATELRFEGDNSGKYDDLEWIGTKSVDIKITATGHTRLTGCDLRKIVEWLHIETPQPESQVLPRFEFIGFEEVANCYRAGDPGMPFEGHWSMTIHLTDCQNVHDCIVESMVNCHEINNIWMYRYSYFENCTKISNIEILYESAWSTPYFENCSHISNVILSGFSGDEWYEGDGQYAESIAYENCRFVDINTCEGIITPSDNGKLLALNYQGKLETVELAPHLTSITYDELVTLRNNSQLIPGTFYRIINYECTSSDENTACGDHYFDIVVQALTTNTLSENASAVAHLGKHPNLCTGTIKGEYLALSGEEGRLEPYSVVVDYIETFDGSDYNTEEGITKDVFIGYGYVDDVLVLYKTDACGIPGTEDYDEDYADPDMTDMFYYVGKAESPTGSICDVWRKHETSEDNGDYSLGGCEKYFYTNNIVDEPQVVRAISVSTTVNYSAWELKYSLDNDGNRFAWADEDSGKGVIYYMKDEWNNECPYDFKNIQFKRPISFDENGCLIYDPDNSEVAYVHTFTAYDMDKSEYLDASSNLNGLILDGGAPNCYNNIISNYYDNDPIQRLQLNNIVFLNSFSLDAYESFSCDSNIFGTNCDSNTFGNNCHHNTFGNNCYSNTFGNDCYSNTFGNDCPSNTFSNGCRQNTFSNYCRGCAFGNYCRDNTFGNDCTANTFGNDCYSNTFGNDCTANTFGNDCYSNTFGNYCGENTFVGNCNQNTFRNDCSNNIFKSICHENTFGNNCNYNTFGSQCRRTTFENDCDYNTFEGGCYSVTFGNACSNNTFGGTKDVLIYVSAVRFADYCKYIKITTQDFGGLTKMVKNVTVCPGVSGTKETPLTLNVSRNAPPVVYEAAGTTHIILD